MTILFFLVSVVLFMVFIFRYMKESSERKSMIINLVTILVSLLFMIFGIMQSFQGSAEIANEKDSEINKLRDEVSSVTLEKEDLEIKIKEDVDKLEQELNQLEKDKSADVEKAVKKEKEKLDNQYEVKIEEAVKEAVAKVKADYEAQLATAEEAEDVDSSYSEPDTSSSLVYDPFGADLDCGDFASQADAQAVYEAAGGPSQDPHDLDRDNDGVACDAN